MMFLALLGSMFLFASITSTINSNHCCGSLSACSCSVAILFASVYRRPLPCVLSQAIVSVSSSVSMICPM